MKKIFAAFYFIFLCFASHAQHRLGEHLDSFTAFRATYFYANAPEKLYAIDTSINNLEEYNFIQRASDEYLHLGNVGTAAFPIMNKPLLPTGFQNGIRQYDLYWLYMDSIKLYDIKRPFSELTMNLGLRQELNFSGRHSQNLGKQFQYGISFNRINSVGYYDRQRTVGNSASFYSRYITKNKKFVSYISFVYNGFKNQENGGLAFDAFSDTIPKGTFVVKEQIPTNLLLAQNNYREVALQGSQSYEIGYKYEEKINDTTLIKNYQPLVNIKYQIKLASNKSNYIDKSTTIDSLYYLNFYYNKIDNEAIDTLSHLLRYNSITQSISVNFLGDKKVKNAKGKAINLVAGASILHENIELVQNRYEFTTNNLSISGYIRSNAKANKRWNYLANAQFFLAGYNQGDIDIKGKFSYDLKKIGLLSIQATWNRRAATWLENQYHSFANSWNNDFSKVNTIHLSAAYFNSYTQKKLQINGGIQVKNYVINNYIYWDASSKPNQTATPINLFQIEASLNLAYGKVHLDNYFCFQKNSNNAIIRNPTFYLKNSLYYERLAFKKAMLVRIGIDSRFISSYYANAYNPLIGQFYIQDEQKMKYTPMIDVFINMKIKTVRIFLKGNNLLQGVGLRGTYNAFLYPSDERSFKFGVTWRFLD